jgi:hypothetical protein
MANVSRLVRLRNFTSDPAFDGIIDEFRVYNRALSATEVQALKSWQ